MTIGDRDSLAQGRLSFDDVVGELQKRLQGQPTNMAPILRPLPILFYDPQM